MKAPPKTIAELVQTPVKGIITAYIGPIESLPPKYQTLWEKRWMENYTAFGMSDAAAKMEARYEVMRKMWKEFSKKQLKEWKKKQPTMFEEAK